MSLRLSLPCWLGGKSSARMAILMVAGGWGKVSVGVERDRVAIRQVEEVDAEDAVEIAGFGLDGGVESLEEEMFFLWRRLLGE